MIFTTERHLLLRAAAAVCLGLVLLVGGPSGQAHVVYGTKTLRGLTAEADLVLRARIVSADDRLPLEASLASARRPFVEAEVIEVLKGKLEQERVRFVQHGHGVARFDPGDETLLFLIDIARSRELDALGQAGAYAWVSLQEQQDEYPLEPDTRKRLLAVIRAYVAVEEQGSRDARLTALRTATRDLLTSGDARLAASALRDLVASPGLPLVAAEDLPALRAVIDDPSVSMGVRVGLLAELDGRGLLDGPPIWLRLLSDETAPRDRITAIRAAGGVANESVRTRLIALVSDTKADVAAAAVAALGTPGNVEAIAPLSQALAQASAPVRMAAIRGLGRIGTAEADRALEKAANSHSDSETRRRAQAEMRKRGSKASGDGAEVVRAWEPE
jgi:hypothetical protein